MSLGHAAGSWLRSRSLCLGLSLLLAGPLAGFVQSARAADVFVEDVVHRVTAQDNAITDQTALLTIRHTDRQGVERVSTHRLYWKNTFGNKGLIGKALLITLTPFDKRGEGFLLWQAEAANESQAWLYLPELRHVRRLAIAGHQEHDHKQKQPGLDLGFEQLGTRLVGAGGELVGRESLNGVDHVILDDHADMSQDLLPLRRFWVSFSDSTIGKIEYRDASGRLVRSQEIAWDRIPEGWVWKRTVIRPQDGPGNTVVELSEVTVNSGLADRLFTVETLKSGRVP